ncbi:MAG: hypothetical protein IPN55_07620 [Saprospiraceae bacterium]|nr:hypothetical protein [Candidatus Brachybacter algidus]
MRAINAELQILPLCPPCRRPAYFVSNRATTGIRKYKLWTFDQTCWLIMTGAIEPSLPLPEGVLVSIPFHGFLILC